jgi:hypothetical protein
MPAITAPVPTLPAGQPVSGSTSILKIALAYDASGVVVATPVFSQIPVMGEVSLTFNPASTMYPAYVASGLSVWDYAVKTGMAATLTFKSAVPGTDTVVGPIVKAALTSGNGAVALFTLMNPDGTYYSGACVLGLSGTNTPVRGISEYTFTAPTSGAVQFTNA